MYSINGIVFGCLSFFLIGALGEILHIQLLVASGMLIGSILGLLWGF